MPKHKYHLLIRFHDGQTRNYADLWLTEDIGGGAQSGVMHGETGPERAQAFGEFLQALGIPVEIERFQYSEKGIEGVSRDKGSREVEKQHKPKFKPKYRRKKG